MRLPSATPGSLEASRFLRLLTNRSRWLAAELRHLAWRVHDVVAAGSACRRGGRRRMLFVATNALALKQFALLRDALRGGDGCCWAVTHSPRDVSAQEAVWVWCSHAEVDYLPFPKARRRAWDLIVFADHDDMERFPVNVPKVRISHGIYGSKLVDGVPYRYDPRWVEHRGRVFYSRMFEPSEAAVRFGVAHNPRLEGILVAVGDLAADCMLALRGQRDAIREAHAYGPGDRVVLLQSTYGPTSLMETIGRELVAECVRLAATGRWRFILQTHPHHWSGARPDVPPCGAMLLAQEGKPGIRIIHQGEDWATHMIASDMVITDHTSLSMTYALLGKPMLFVDGRAELIEGNPGQRLAAVLPKLGAPETLEPDLLAALESLPEKQVKEITGDILSYPGEAAERVRREVYELLGLSVRDDN